MIRYQVFTQCRLQCPGNRIEHRSARHRLLVAARLQRTRMNLRSILAAVPMLLLGLVAPGCCPEPQPNGLRETLSFAFSGADVASGLGVEQWVIQEQVRTGSECATASRDYDFAGTTLELEAPTGLSIGAVTPAGVNDGGSPWRFPVTCQEPTGRLEVNVRVMADGRPRYEDAFAVTCRTAAALTLTPRDWGVCTYRLSGETLTLATRLEAEDGADLLGKGLTVPAADAALVEIVEERLREVDIRLLGPGDGFSLAAGAASARVDVIVLADDSPDWALELREISAERLTDGFVGLEATAGESVCGLGPCTLEVTGAEGTTTGCHWVAPASDTPRQVRACASARGRTICADFTL
jgi:hypothetical protein